MLFIDLMKDLEYLALDRPLITFEVHIDRIVRSHHHPFVWRAGDDGGLVERVFIEISELPKPNRARFEAALALDDSHARADGDCGGGVICGGYLFAIARIFTEAQTILGVDPMRVRDGRIVRPDSGPFIRIAEELRGDIPERIAAFHDVDVGDGFGARRREAHLGVS